MAEPIRYTLRMVAERAAFEPYWVGISRETARDMLARIRALEADVAILRAEIARKDEALRPFARIAEHDIGETETDTDLYRPMQPQNARAPLPTAGDFRRARAALGPWRPTHQLPGGAMVRQRAVNAYDGGRAIDLFEARDGTLYSRYPDDQRVRPLTPAEQATYVEAAMGERT